MNERLDIETFEPPKTLTLERLRELNYNQYPIHKYGETFSVVIFGETHYSGIDEQLLFVREVQPEFVLHEFLSAYIFDPETNQFHEQDRRHLYRQARTVRRPRLPPGDVFGEPSPDEAIDPRWIDLSRELRFKIVGIDLTYAEMEDESMSSGKKTKLTDLRSVDSVGEEARDSHMSEMIYQYQKQSSRPLITVMGIRHARHIHKRRLSQDRGFGYAFFDQTKSYKK